MLVVISKTLAILRKSSRANSSNPYMNPNENQKMLQSKWNLLQRISFELDQFDSAVHCYTASYAGRKEKNFFCPTWGPKSGFSFLFNLALHLKPNWVFLPGYEADCIVKILKILRRIFCYGTRGHRIWAAFENPGDFFQNQWILEKKRFSTIVAIHT